MPSQNYKQEQEKEQNINEILDDLDELTPEMIAHLLFSKTPDDPLTKQLLICQPDEECENPGTFVHEILMTVLLEGIMQFYKNLTEINLSDINSEHIQALSPWFKSLRFNLIVTELNKEENIEQYIHFYCKIILKKMAEYSLYFKLKNIPTEYTFFLNPLYGSNYPVMDINNIYSVIFLKNRVFKIQFKILQESDIFSNNINELKQ